MVSEQSVRCNSNRCPVEANKPNQSLSWATQIIINHNNRPVVVESIEIEFTVIHFLQYNVGNVHKCTHYLQHSYCL